MFRNTTTDEDTYASIEREIAERTVAQQARLVIRHAVADLLVDLGCRALERVKAVQVGDFGRVLDPGEELFGGDDPDC